MAPLQGGLHIDGVRFHFKTRYKASSYVGCLVVAGLDCFVNSWVMLLVLLIVESTAICLPALSSATDAACIAYCQQYAGWCCSFVYWWIVIVA